MNLTTYFIYFHQEWQGCLLVLITPRVTHNTGRHILTRLRGRSLITANKGINKFQRVSYTQRYLHTWITESIVKRITFSCNFSGGQFDLAVDVACASGQSTIPLSKYFKVWVNKIETKSSTWLKVHLDWAKTNTKAIFFLVSTYGKTSDLGWPKFTPKYPPPPISEKLQIWDDQSLLQNTPLPPPHFGKLQIWDDQSLLRNTPPPMKIVRESKSESFRIQRVTTCGEFIQPG